MNRVSVLIMALLLILVCRNAWPREDEIGDLWEMSLEDLLATEVSVASKSSLELRKAPARIIVIDAEKIKERGYGNFEEILHDLPGFDFNKGMGVNWSTIFMRGLRSNNSDRFLFIWDGVVQNDIWKQTNWISRQYPLSNVDRIEIMYGPASLLYGSNAFSGIINVILKDPGSEPEGEYRVMAGSFRTLGHDVSWSGKIGGASLSITGLYFTSQEADYSGKHYIDEGGVARPYDTILSDMLVAGDAAACAQFNIDHPELADCALNFNADGQVSYRDPATGALWPIDSSYSNPTRDSFIQARLNTGRLKLGAFFWTRREGEGPWYAPFKRTTSDGIWTPTGGAVSLSYTQELNSRISLAHSLNWRYSGIDKDTSRAPSFKFYSTGDPSDPWDHKIYSTTPPYWYDLWATEWKLSEQMNYRHERSDVVLGLEYTRTKTPEDYDYTLTPQTNWPAPSPEHKEETVSLFGGWMAGISSELSGYLGLRFDNNEEVGGPGGFGGIFTKRMALIYTPTPKWSHKLIYGEAFQAPDAWTKYSALPNERIAAPNLEPEELKSWELAAEYQPRPGLNATLSLYTSRVKNMIAATDIGGGIVQNRNIGEVKVQGLEFSLEQTLSRKWSAWINGGTISARDEISHRNVGDIAPLRLNLGLNWKQSKGRNLNIRGNYAARRKTINHDSNSPYVVTSVAPSFVLNAAYGVDNFLPGADFKLTINNLLNTRYFDPGVRSADGGTYNAVILQEPRRAFVSVVYHF